MNLAEATRQHQAELEACRGLRERYGDVLAMSAELELAEERLAGAETALFAAWVEQRGGAWLTEAAT